MRLDTVELIEAAPAARGREAAQHLLELDWLYIVGAVEDDAHARNALRQILCCLRLTGTGRSLGRAAVVEVVRGGEAAVAAVGQRCDDEARRVAQVLVSIRQRRNRLPHGDGRQLDALLPLLRRTLHVVAQLRDPRKVLKLRDRLIIKHGRNVAGVDVENDQHLQRLKVNCGEVFAHQQGQIVQLPLDARLAGLQFALRDRVLHLHRPHHLRHRRDNLAGPPQRPRCAAGGGHVRALVIEEARAGGAATGGATAGGRQQRGVLGGRGEVVSVGTVASGGRGVGARVQVVVEGLNRLCVDCLAHALLDALKPIFNNALVLRDGVDVADEQDTLAHVTPHTLDNGEGGVRRGLVGRVAGGRIRNKFACVGSVGTALSLLQRHD